MEVKKASSEQLEILHHIRQGSNVIVDAIAGSGKSTTILTVAQALPHRRFLQITYNAMLRKEFRTKVQEAGLGNIEVHTYHSLAVKYYSKDAFTDAGIRRILLDKGHPLCPIPAFDVVVLDECQDQTPLYYHFVRWILESTQSNLQLLLLGDYMQCLYEFKGADMRFLTMADRLWATCPAVSSTLFARCSLKTSYRITNQMASFLNHVMLGEERLLACRHGDPVYYFRHSRSNLEKIVIYHIKRLLAEGDLPSDIFILGPSVKGTMSNIRRLENVLVDSGIPCHVPTLEVDKLDEKVADGKVVFSTFHTVKGRQRKYVFVVGFDHSYFAIYARNLAEDVCPNTLYVACTRATHKLFLMEIDQYATDRPLPFLKMDHHTMKTQEYVEFKGNARTIFWDKAATDAQEEGVVCQVTVSDLIRFIPEDVIDEITPWVLGMFVAKEVDLPGFTEEEIPSVVQFASGMYEDVSDLNGIAIPCMYYDTLSENTYTPNVLYKLIEGYAEDMKPSEHSFLRDVFRSLGEQCSTISDYLYMSNVYTAFQERLYFKLKQIQRSEYTWISDAVMRRCTELLDRVIGDTEYISEEQTILHYNMETEHAAIDALLERELGGGGRKYRFKARVDLISDHDIWELKCTTNVSMDHMLQTILYAWMWKMVNPESDKGFQLFNIKTAEHYELVGSLEDLTKVVVALLKGKYGQPVVLDDAAFLDSYTDHGCEGGSEENA